MRFFAVILCCLVAGCSLPTHQQIENWNRPGVKDRIDYKTAFLGEDQPWHDNCLFLENTADMTPGELGIAQLNADALYWGRDHQVRGAWRRAAISLEQASNNGLPMAQVLLASQYLTGKGVERSPRRGAELIRRASYMDCAAAQHRYAELYTRSSAVSGDLQESLAWARLAYDQGYTDVEDLLKRLGGVMSRSQIANGLERARVLRAEIDDLKGARGQTFVTCRHPVTEVDSVLRLRRCLSIGGKPSAFQ